MANTTIYDVAGAAKVSLATVSRVMNNPEKVNPETREKVLKVIKELGYRPNAIARGLASPMYLELQQLSYLVVLLISLRSMIML